LRHPGEKPPVEPVAALAHTAAGAKAFAEFFIKTIDWGYATIDGSYIRHHSSANCISCASLADGLDKDRAAGRRYLGGRLAIIESSPVARGWQHGEVVAANGTAFEVVTRSGKPVSAEPAHPHLRYTVTLEWANDHWLVEELAVNL
jgi:hypothetical protein